MTAASTLTNTLYGASPEWMRSLIVSLDGARTMRQRFGRYYALQSRLIETSQWNPTREALRRSRVEACALGAFAVRESPYHRAWAAKRGGAPAFDDLEAFPVLSKAEVRERVGQFTPARVGRVRKALKRHTSGTTGTPLEILVTSESFQREYAFAWQHRLWFGCPRGVRTATLAGHPVVPTAETRPPFWVHNFSENQILFSSYHMSPQNLPAYARALGEFSPELVHGYPSSIALVAAALLDSGAKVRPRCVITASETLLPHQRVVIREAFGVEPRIWYGNTELAGNIVECPEGRLHVREDHSFLEFLREDGTPAAAHETGRLIATAFGNRATVLVRYDTGDLVVLSGEESCSCERGGRLVSEIVGRADDFVIDGEGRLIGRLDHLFKDARGVKQAQIVQREPGEVIVRIVAEGVPGAQIEDPVRREAARRLSPKTRIAFEYVDSLQRKPSGKIPFVISELHGRAGPLARLAGSESETEPDQPGPR